MSIQWQGKTYRRIDCGSDGNCLFTSLGFTLLMTGQLGSEETGGSLRDNCIEILTNWVQDGVPDWFDDQNYETPDEERINALLSGDWGDATTLLATLLNHHPNVRVTVLWREDGQLRNWTVDASAAGHDIDTDVLLWWNGATHYQALEEGDDGLDEENLDDEDEEEEEEEEGGSSQLKVPTKVSSGSKLSTSITTIKLAGPLEIHMLDVGQGEATLILFGGTVILIDGGHTTRGGGTIRRHLAKRKINTINHMICTHYDADHVEGLTDVLNSSITVEQVWTPGMLFVGNDERKGLAEGLDNKYRDFAQAIIKRSKKLSRRMEAGDSIDVGPLHITCLTSGAGTGFQSNDHSIALRVKYYRFTYYTAGDLESGREKQIVGEITVGKGHLCAMKCGHHGASGSTPPALLKRCRPQVALISCGAQSYCHPDDALIDRLCGAKSIQQFYLTNCFYNRAGVNPSYGTRLKAEQQEWDDRKKNKKRDRESRRDKKLDSYRPVAVKRTLRGVVAGNTTHLGTIIIRIDGAQAVKPKHFFEVGYYDQSNGWTWKKHICRDKVEDGERDDDRTSFVNIKGLDTNSNELWLTDVEALHKVPRFSLLTKPPTEKKEKVPLDDEEIFYAVKQELDSSDSSGSEYEDESDDKQKQKKVKKDPEDEKKKDDEDEEEEEEL